MLETYYLKFIARQLHAQNNLKSKKTQYWPTGIVEKPTMVLFVQGNPGCISAAKFHLQLIFTCRNYALNEI